MRLAALGVGLGVVASLGVGRVFSSLLYGLSPADPVALGGACLVLLLVAFVANYVPARRAARIDPNVALRYE